MYARSTSLLANPSAIEEGVAHVKNEVLPALERVDGFIGLSMLVERDGTRCIATSAWQDEATMRASANYVQPIRNGVAEILGGLPDVAEWEIALMHRDHPTHEGACVRTTWLQTDPTNVAKGVEYYRRVVLPQITQLREFSSVSFLLNRGTGIGVSSVAFENSAALDDSRAVMDEIATAATSQIDAKVRDVVEFDLLLAHLRVPETV